MLICMCLLSLPWCWHILTFSLICAPHIPSYCGNHSESRLDLFWDRPPVASYGDQREHCLPLWVPPVVVATLHHWVSSVICFFLAQLPSGDPNTVLFSAATLMSHIIVWFNCSHSVNKFIQSRAGRKSLGTYMSPTDKMWPFFFLHHLNFLLLINAWHCLLVWYLSPKGYCGACMYII